MDQRYAPPKALIPGEGSSARRPDPLFWLIAVGSSLLALVTGIIGSLSSIDYSSLPINILKTFPPITLLVWQYGQWLWLLSALTLLVWINFMKSTPKKTTLYSSLFIAIGITASALSAGCVWVTQYMEW